MDHSVIENFGVWLFGLVCGLVLMNYWWSLPTTWAKGGEQ